MTARMFMFRFEFDFEGKQNHLIYTLKTSTLGVLLYVFFLYDF